MFPSVRYYAILGLITYMTISTAIASEMCKESITSLGGIPDGYEIINESLKYSPDFKHISYAAFSNTKNNIVRFDDRTSPVYIAVRPGYPVFAPGTNRNAYIAYRTENKAVCVVDWEAGPEFDNIDQFLFSPDGKRYAYRAAKDGKQCIVIDGKPGPLFKGIPVKENMTFSPDAKRFAYVALTDAGCILVLDGIQQANTYNFIQDVIFSPDSTQIAFKARIEKKGNSEKWKAIRNGISGQVYNKIFDLFFSPDSNRFAYSAVKDKQMVLVIDGIEKPPHDVYGLPVFSADSKTLAYVYSKNEKYHFVINGKEQDDNFDKFYKFFYSPDSLNYAYIANKKDSWHCVYNGNIGLAYKSIEGFKFSEDSSKYAYGAVTEKGGQIVVNGKEGKAYTSVGEPYFSPDSRHVVHKAVDTERDKWTTILNEKQIGLFYASIGKYFFSKNSRHLAYSAMKNPNHILMVVDHQEQCRKQMFNIVGDPYFSPDGEHIAYYAMLEPEKWKLVVDGRVLDEVYGGFIKTTPIVFDSGTKFHTLAIRIPGPEFVRIDVIIPAEWKLETEIRSS